MEKLTIVHVADYVMPGMGYQEFALAKWNARHGHEVHMVTSDRYTPVPHYEDTWESFLGPRLIGPGVEQIEGVTIHRLPCRLELKRRPWLAGLSDELERIRPDVVRLWKDGVVIEEREIGAAEGGVWLDHAFQVTADSDAWFVVEVDGDTPLGHVWGSSTPYALTNAFFLDVP